MAKRNYTVADTEAENSSFRYQSDRRELTSLELDAIFAQECEDEVILSDLFDNETVRNFELEAMRDYDDSASQRWDNSGASRYFDDRNDY